MTDMILDDLEPEVKARIAQLAKLWKVSEEEALNRIIKELPQENDLPFGVRLARYMGEKKFSL